jgi:glutamate-1-semialdehyde aminotransferase/spore coat polysaccharide biosynthesis protein SpsF (cytidylyltransferase family)
MAIKNNKVLAIVQARYDSTRLPGKVLKKLNNKSILEIIIKRLSKCKNISKIIVACSNNKNDVKIINLCKKLKIDFFIGSEHNVLERFYKATVKFKGLNILRITADCPFVDYVIVDKIINNFFLNNYDYASNIDPPTFPDGLDAEIFTFNVLKETYKKAKTSIYREHIRPFILNSNKFKKFNLTNDQDYSFLRLTVDEPEDLKVIRNIINNFKNNIFFLYEDIIDLYKRKKILFLDNMNISRNEGMNLNKGQKLWKRAKNIIPGGTMLFSKNPDLFLPNFWPAYFDKTKGCNVWDLEGRKYLDLSMMGVGTNILGYSRKEVDDAVRKVVNKGNMSTLNSKEEILLAEKLVQMHPWASKVRFARTGGEAAAIAVRIARAATGKDKIAVCGYHGWHDWYLSANLSDSKNLNSHLMRNLPIQGVQKNLKNTAFVFEYNNFDQLKKIISQNNIGTVIMEVSRNEPPKKNFLENVRQLTKNKNIVLIFDECTSGFRETFGGLHLKYKINPDIATFGKALGNGYAVNAVIGTDSIMSYANSTFISSTFWTERIGSAAGLKTLEIMETTKSWEIITGIGLEMQNVWKEVFSKFHLDFKFSGIPALSTFSITSEFGNSLKTFITREFLKENVLASNIFYPSTSHSHEDIVNYRNKLLSIMETLDFDNLKDLEIEEARQGFGRLN